MVLSSATDGPLRRRFQRPPSSTPEHGSPRDLDLVPLYVTSKLGAGVSTTPISAPIRSPTVLTRRVAVMRVVAFAALAVVAANTSVPNCTASVPAVTAPLPCVASDTPTLTTLAVTQQGRQDCRPNLALWRCRASPRVDDPTMHPFRAYFLEAVDMFAIGGPLGALATLSADEPYVFSGGRCVVPAVSWEVDAVTFHGDDRAAAVPSSCLNKLEPVEGNLPLREEGLIRSGKPLPHCPMNYRRQLPHPAPPSVTVHHVGAHEGFDTRTTQFGADLPYFPAPNLLSPRTVQSWHLDIAFGPAICPEFASAASGVVVIASGAGFASDDEDRSLMRKPWFAKHYGPLLAKAQQLGKSARLHIFDPDQRSFSHRGSSEANPAFRVESHRALLWDRSGFVSFVRRLWSYSSSEIESKEERSKAAAWPSSVPKVTPSRPRRGSGAPFRDLDVEQRSAADDTQVVIDDVLFTTSLLNIHNSPEQPHHVLHTVPGVAVVPTIRGLVVDEEEYVVLVLDGHGSEWSMVESLIASGTLAALVDEIFVVCHSAEWLPNWPTRHSASDCHRMVHAMRKQGVLAHQWYEKPPKDRPFTA